MTGLLFSRKFRFAKAFLLPALFFCLPVFLPQPAAAQRLAGGETRSLKIYFVHSGEKDDVIFKKNGRYVRSGLKRLDYLLRDWRRNEADNMDPRLFDLVWQIYQLSGSQAYIHVVSGYRSPQTNAMLRLAMPAGGVAKHSRHMEGRAMDFYLPDVNLAYLRAIALKLQGGGIGYYPASRSPFVHVDVGSVRHWPRMSRAALAALFPDGRTLHVPRDGRPLAGYAEAEADYERRGAAALPVYSARALFGGALPQNIILAAADGRLPGGQGRGAAFAPLAAAAPPLFAAVSLPAHGPVPLAAPHLGAEADEADDEADIKTASIPVPQFKTAVSRDEIGSLLAYAPPSAADYPASSRALQALALLAPVPAAKPQAAAQAAFAAPLPQFKPKKPAAAVLAAVLPAALLRHVPLPQAKAPERKRK